MNVACYPPDCEWLFCRKPPAVYASQHPVLRAANLSTANAEDFLFPLLRDLYECVAMRLSFISDKVPYGVFQCPATCPHALVCG